MGVPLTPKAIGFLGEKVFAHVATLMQDGSPQITPVWVWTDGKDLLFNCEETSLKARNLRRDDRVALSVMGLDSPLRTITVRGRVTEMTTKGAVDDINRMAMKYNGDAVYKGFRQGVARLTVRVEPLTLRESL